MSIIKVFFMREITRLHRNIEALSRGVNGELPELNSQIEGQQQMLQAAYRCRQLLLDLAEEASDLTALQLTLRVRYGAAMRAHDRIRARQNGTPAARSAQWWEALGDMQYYAHLQASLNELLRQYTEEEIQQEIRRAARARDLSSTAEHDEILHAMASAEASAGSKLALVRHDPRLSAPDDDDEQIS